MQLEQKVAQRLIANQQTLAVAESCTGGLLAHRLTNVPGSSHFLKLGIIAYSNEAKVKLLHVPPKSLRADGAVSGQTALAMAKGARKILKTDFGIAITGIAGPGGATPQKPVGLTHIAIDAGGQTVHAQYHFQGRRTQIKSQAATQALRLLWELLNG